MAKLKMATPFDSNNGKYAKTDQIYFKTRRFDEQVIGVRQKHPTTNEPPTANQQAAQTQFATVAAQVKTALADPTQKTALKAEWKQQKKCKTLTGYVFRKIYLNLNGD